MWEEGEIWGGLEVNNGGNRAVTMYEGGCNNVGRGHNNV